MNLADEVHQPSEERNEDQDQEDPYGTGEVLLVHRRLPFEVKIEILSEASEPSCCGMEGVIWLATNARIHIRRARTHIVAVERRDL